MSDPPAQLGRLKYALADRYRIERQLGAGGMATVYLAYELRHDRYVAIKVLRPELAAVLGAERFVREIKTTAQLQHPHILPLFDSGEADSFLYYVMPYIEGETLRTKLDREKQLAIDEAVRITTEVADALDYAHRQNVVHRDIKPENVLLHDGRPMVADFGIALAVSAAAGGRMTETGLSLGTPHYMSPEQATAEKDLGHRSDIYSLGAVLYEMLTGSPPHMGSTAQQIIAKIATDVPRRVTELRKSVPANVAAAVAKALEKLPADRFARASAFAHALADPSFGVAGSEQHTPLSREHQWKRTAIAAFATAGILLGVGTWGWLRPYAAPSTPMVRYGILLPDSEARAPTTLSQSGLALSPDGSRFVYVGPGPQGTRLWVRARDELHATPLPGTNGAFNPFFSPDGSRVGFFVWVSAGVERLMVVSLAGGPPRVVADGPDIEGGGGSWGSDGFLYIDGGLEGDGLARVPEGGGSVEAVTMPDTARGEAWHSRPHVLPNGKGVLFTAAGNRGLDAHEIAVADLAAGTHRVLVRGTHAIYATSGHLVYVTADGILMAARFDQKKLVLTGDPVALGGPVYVSVLGVSELGVANNGTFMYTAEAPAGAVEELDHVVWVTRDGETKTTDFTVRGSVLEVALAPDWTRLALRVYAGGESHVWIKHLSQGPLQKLTVEGPWNGYPVWTPDGRSVTFASRRAGQSQFALYRRRADGSGSEEVLLDRDQSIDSGIWSRDGQWLVYQADDNLYALRPEVDTVPRTLAASPFKESWPALSPNGRWLAYMSDESGASEVYVVPFPDTGNRKWLVSIGGGAAPVWAHSGRELFYRNGHGELMAVAVATEGTFRMSGQRALFTFLGYSGIVPWWWWTEVNYDVAADDQAFVMPRGSSPGRTRVELVVVENFFEELRAKVGR